LWYRRLNGHDFSEEQFLFPLGIELFITSEDDVDGFTSILELRIVRFVPLVILFGLFVRWLVLLAATVKRPPIREDQKALLYQSQEADNTFITSDGTLRGNGQ
jgi:hypothetical protein